ncbi:MAG: type 2 isopentenyl-diphosphate Delta-isomerase, partial [Promethearchaeota archaeon]
MVNEDPTIYQRKEEHIRLAIENDGYSSGDIWLDRVNVVHEPFPQLNFSDIDLQTSFLGKTISAPILIDALTGGTSTSYTINKNLAEFAAQKSLPICVGSQRIMLKPDSHLESFRIVRKSNPDGIVLGNIGISQILQMESFTPISEILDVIEADGLCVHLNVLQELIQQQEPLNFKDGLAKISQLSDYLQIPIIFKEVGVGMSREFAERLIKQGFDCFNIAGFGGTNFTRIEARRNQDRDS